ncbi:hypothetical protein Taro_008888 [Colocasia esculenta]|uniref:Uncharacterized protein n=1 Tax=Colocasia esculenta TaxID=4460 RepID=A0A843U2F2_COLES|nr:hypothetical protein [Colocasia esculenta]
MGLRPCGPQVVVFSWSPQLFDLSRGAAAGPFVRGCETERSLKWQIEEIGVVEEMIQRRALTVWSLTGLVSIEGDVNFMNLTAGFVDVYCDGSLNDNRVDANLCDLQNIGLPKDSSLTPFSLSLALFSYLCFPIASNGCRRLVGDRGTQPTVAGVAQVVPEVLALPAAHLQSPLDPHPEQAYSNVGSFQP